MLSYPVILETIHGMVSDKISTVPLIGHKIITYSISLKYIKTDLIINVLLILAFFNSQHLMYKNNPQTNFIFIQSMVVLKGHAHLCL